MRMGSEVSIETLRQLLRLDPETGKLFWRERPVEFFSDGGHSAAHNCAAWNARWAGKEAFKAPCTNAYLQGTIFAEKYLKHRVIFALHHGRWPVGEIDHWDTDESNNRPGNLREATRAQNGRNRGANKSSTSRFCGVSWDTERQKWMASCYTAGGKQRNLGRFTDEIDAARAYNAFAREHHGEFARLNVVS